MPLKKEPRKRLLFYCRAQARLFSRPKGAGSLCSPKGLLLFCAYRAQGDSIAARQRCIHSLRRAGDADKGGVSLFQKEIPLPYTLPEKIRIASELLEELRRLPIALPIARRSRVGLCYTTWLAPTIRCRSAHLIEVRSNHRLPEC